MKLRLDSNDIYKKKKHSWSLATDVDEGWGGGVMHWMERMSANHAAPPPPANFPPLRSTPLPQPESLSRSLRHILSPHLSQHIKLLVLPQLHTRRCCHAKHRSARPSDCWGGAEDLSVRCCKMSWIMQCFASRHTQSKKRPPNSILNVPTLKCLQPPQ